MTEWQWLNRTDPQKMLHFLGNTLSLRKGRLLACACCRRVAPAANNPDLTLNELSERYADGMATVEEINRVPDPTYSSSIRLGDCFTVATRLAVHAAIRTNIYSACSYAVMVRRDHARSETGYANNVERCDAMLAATAAEATAQTELIRDIVGNPFHPVILKPAWLAWNDGTVPKIARAIYDERAFEQMPILADALEDASCDKADILAHCRSEGPHVRGCWVVDLILGKQ
jgi:hypothetical protein